MRHLLPVIAFLALSGCPDHSGEGSPTLDSLTGPGASELAGDAGPDEYQFTWNLVMITDTTVKGCDPEGPGVEIDAVEIVRDGAALGPADGVAPSLNGASL